MQRLKKCRGDGETELAASTLSYQLACSTPPPALLLRSETCPRCLSRVRHVLVYGVLGVTCIKGTPESLCSRPVAWAALWLLLTWPRSPHKHTLLPRRVSTSSPGVGGWWRGAVPCIALHLWGHLHPPGGKWRIRNRRTLYFLNNSFPGASCWSP